VKSDKSDFLNAEAIAEVVARQNMRLVYWKRSLRALVMDNASPSV
jgi:hypothetical protein